MKLFDDAREMLPVIEDAGIQWTIHYALSEFAPEAQEQMDRMEAKLDAIMEHLGIQAPAKDERRGQQHDVGFPA